MSRQQVEEEERDFEGLLTVFEGSSPGDVSHAKRLWGSVSLLPPLESCLISSDIRQRLPVARSSGSRTSAGPGATCPGKPRSGGGQEEKEEEVERRRRCESMALRREEILGLLWSQRERRLRKELVGRPGVKNRQEPALEPHEPREVAADREMVHQLQ
ncbi:unnamed protein product [Lota lota]